MDFKKILIAVEDSPIGAHAIETGVDLARSLSAQIALVRVTCPPGADGADAGVSSAALLAQEQRDDKRVLEGVRERLSLPASVLEFVPVGDPSVEIIKAAKQWPADLIVIGSHGRSGMSRVMLGSVAEAVTRHAPCPVLIVRAKI